VSAAAGARERILRATLEVIGEQGVGGVTNRIVAKRAALSLGSLTYHFPSQTELLRESLLLFVSDEAERLEAFASGLTGTDLTLEEVADGIQQIVRDPRPHEVLAQFELYLQAARDPELRDVAARCYAAYDRAARTTLVALGVPDPDPLVPAVIALMDGFELRRLTLGAPPDGSLTDALVSLVRAARGAHV
jgi:DNA-binding transcriptional regulator YbjK